MTRHRCGSRSVARSSSGTPAATSIPRRRPRSTPASSAAARRPARPSRPPARSRSCASSIPTCAARSRSWPRPVATVAPSPSRRDRPRPRRLRPCRHRPPTRRRSWSVLRPRCRWTPPISRSVPRRSRSQPAAGVTWTNRGVAPHSVTAKDGAFDSGMLESGATFAQTFATPGSYAYLCAFHPEMTATVRVVAATSGSGVGAATSGGTAAGRHRPMRRHRPAGGTDRCGISAAGGARHPGHGGQQAGDRRVEPGRHRARGHARVRGRSTLLESRSRHGAQPEVRRRYVPDERRLPHSGDGPISAAWVRASEPSGSVVVGANQTWAGKSAVQSVAHLADRAWTHRAHAARNPVGRGTRSRHPGDVHGAITWRGPRSASSAADTRAFTSRWLGGSPPTFPNGRSNRRSHFRSTASAGSSTSSPGTRAIERS